MTEGLSLIMRVSTMTEGLSLIMRFSTNLNRCLSSDLADSA
jgi:hypothetical protein